MTINIFEYATRNKLRFTSTKGELTLEQLWDVPLRSKDDFNLNVVAKTAHKTLRDATEESFVDAHRTGHHLELEILLDIVKHVIATKISDEELAEKRKANRGIKQQLLAALAAKQAGELTELSVEQLRERINALE